MTLEQVQAAEDPASLLLPVDAYFSGHPMLLLKTTGAEKKLRNGTPLTLEAPDGIYRVYSRQKEFLALAKQEQGRMTTIKSFFEV